MLEKPRFENNPDIMIITTRDLPTFDMESIRGINPKDLPDGLPYHYIGPDLFVCTGRGEGGTNWSTYSQNTEDIKEKSDKGTPDGYEFNVDYVNYNGIRFKNIGESSVKPVWQEDILQEEKQ